MLLQSIECQNVTKKRKRVEAIMEKSDNFCPACLVKNCSRCLVIWLFSGFVECNKKSTELRYGIKDTDC